MKNIFEKFLISTVLLLVSTSVSASGFDKIASVSSAAKHFQENLKSEGILVSYDNYSNSDYLLIKSVNVKLKGKALNIKEIKTISGSLGSTIISGTDLKLMLDSGSVYNIADDIRVTVNKNIYSILSVNVTTKINSSDIKSLFREQYELSYGIAKNIANEDAKKNRIAFISTLYKKSSFFLPEDKNLTIKTNIEFLLNGSISISIHILDRYDDIITISISGYTLNAYSIKNYISKGTAEFNKILSMIIDAIYNVSIENINIYINPEYLRNNNKILYLINRIISPDKVKDNHNVRFKGMDSTSSKIKLAKVIALYQIDSLGITIESRVRFPFINIWNSINRMSFNDISKLVNVNINDNSLDNQMFMESLGLLGFKIKKPETVGVILEAPGF